MQLALVTQGILLNKVQQLPDATRNVVQTLKVAITSYLSAGTLLSSNSAKDLWKLHFISNNNK